MTTIPSPSPSSVAWQSAPSSVLPTIEPENIYFLIAFIVLWIVYLYGMLLIPPRSRWLLLGPVIGIIMAGVGYLAYFASRNLIGFHIWSLLGLPFGVMVFFGPNINTIVIALTGLKLSYLSPFISFAAYVAITGNIAGWLSQPKWMLKMIGLVILITHLAYTWYLYRLIFFSGY